METKIKFTCENQNCEKYNIVVDVKIPEFFIGKCSKCSKQGKLDIVHGDQTFHSSESLIQYFKGLHVEEKLLQRLNEAKIANEDEVFRLKDIENILENAVCPCCNQKPF